MKILSTTLSILIIPILSIARAGDEPKTPLAEQMSGIAKDFKLLRRQIADPAQKQACVTLVKDMEARVAKAKTLEPKKTKDVPAADKDNFVSDFKKSLDGLNEDLGKLESQIQDGKTAEATATLDAIQKDKREGHKKFISEKD